MAKLVIFRGDSVETELHLGREAVRIGRDERNTVVLNDKSVSRFHAEVRQEGGTFYIVDTKSRNGVLMNGHQIKGKAALTLGAPVTLGAYELVLEDDVSTADLGDAAVSGRTVVSTSTGDTSDRPSRSGTRRWGAHTSSTLMKRPALFWSGLAIVTLIVCGLTYLVVGSLGRRPPPHETVAVTTSVPVETPPAEPPPPDHREEITQHLADGQAALDRKDYDAALTEVAAIEALEPENTDAATLKQQTESARAAAVATTAGREKRPQPPAQPAVVEVPGIPVRTGETQADYTTRVTRIKQNMQDGLHLVDRQEFAAALAKFELVKRDQPGYSSVDEIVTETRQKQRQAVDTAIQNGQKSEQEGNLPDAMKWYRQAQSIDHDSAAARDRLAALNDRATKVGMDAFTNAEVYRKRGDTVKAIGYYKQAADLLPNGPEKTQAQQWLEKLKP